MPARSLPGAVLATALGGAALSYLVWQMRRRRRPAPRPIGTIGFVGIGNMGNPIAMRLLQAFHAVTVFNRTPSRCQALADAGALVAPSVEFVLRSCETAFLMLSGDDATRAVISQVRAGQLAHTIVSLSTISPACAREISDICRSHGVDFVACPVTGRPDAAAAGKLLCWLSSDAASEAAACQVAQQLCPAFGRHTDILSTQDAGAAPVFKLLTNFLIYGGVELIAEATALSIRIGLGRGQISRFLELLAPGSFLANYSAKVSQQSYNSVGGAGVDIGLKDMRLIKDLAPGTQLPVLDAALSHLSTVGERLGAEESARTEWAVLATEVERQVVEG